MTYNCFASCSFGLESMTALELRKLGFFGVRASDARVYFCADDAGVARANLWLRTADRVYIELSSFEALSFEQLFEGVRYTAWEEFITKNDMFPVDADSVASGLFSVSDIQSVGKKAVAERLKAAYKTSILPETGKRYNIHLKLLKNQVSACLNTSGAGLNRRGYRKAGAAAPLRETLAAGIVMLSGWKEGEIADPMCGSGTIAIEAAMIGERTAPGLLRTFDSLNWHSFGAAYKKERDAATLQKTNPQPVFASDTDKKAVKIALLNAKAAGVKIKIYNADVKHFSKNGCVVITNPPYAIRLGEKEAVHALYRDMGRGLACADRKYVLSADSQFERYFGKRADKKRKLYNGNIMCTLYQYFANKTYK
ncbi:MAG: class I SAM-dependent RNA methyltransferase [Christensenellales bacterium]